MKLRDRLKTKEFRLRVKQHAAVLDFVTEIQEVMRHREMSQQALATILHKSRAWISKVLRRQPNLTFFTAVEIADALGMDIKIGAIERLTATVEVRPSVPYLKAIPSLTMISEPLIEVGEKGLSISPPPMQPVPGEREAAQLPNKAA